MPRIHSIDVLKLIIAAGVVWAHATLLTLQGGVVAYVLGQGLVRTVVPTFAVISGSNPNLCASSLMFWMISRRKNL